MCRFRTKLYRRLRNRCILAADVTPHVPIEGAWLLVVELAWGGTKVRIFCAPAPIRRRRGNAADGAGGSVTANLSLRLPNPIQRHVQEMADLEGVSVEQFAAGAVSETTSALTTVACSRPLGELADPAALRAALDRVPERAPLPGHG